MPSSLSAVFERNHCVRLRMSSRFTVEAQTDEALVEFMGQTHVRDLTTSQDNRSAQQATFGSLLVLEDGGAYTLQGRVVRRLRGETIGISLNLSIDKRPRGALRPPRHIKPVSRMFAGAAALFGRQLFTCTMNFAYSDDLGVRQAIPLPMSLLQSSPDGVTHIESAMFSKRTDDEIDYTIIVIPPVEDDPLVHMVEFDTDCVLNRACVGHVVQRARIISSMLLVQDKGDSHE